MHKRILHSLNFDKWRFLLPKTQFYCNLTIRYVEYPVMVFCSCSGTVALPVLYIECHLMAHVFIYKKQLRNIAVLTDVAQNPGVLKQIVKGGL